MVQRRLVIWLPAAREGIGVVGTGRKNGEFLDGPAAGGADQGGELIRVDPDLFVPITVEVYHLRRQVLSAPELALGKRQAPPDGLPEVRQVQSTEHTVPVGIVALRPPDGTASRTGIARAAAEQRQGLHLLVHSVRLGVLHQEIAPVRTHSWVPGHPPNFSPSSANRASHWPAPLSELR